MRIGCLALTVVASALSASVAGCGSSPPPKEPTPPPFPTDFTPAPAVDDPDTMRSGVRGGEYLRSVAGVMQPRWSGFLDDLRLRLPPTHPLNQASLEARALLVIGPDGALRSVQVAKGSGQPAFDDAVIEVIHDCDPFPRPPPALTSDDGLVHLSWLFARDRRQAGPATAKALVVKWPLARSIPRLVASAQFRVALDRIAESDEAPSVRVAALDQVATALIKVSLAAAREQRDAAMEAAAYSRDPSLLAPVRAALAAADSPERRTAAIAALVSVGATTATLVKLVRDGDAASARAASRVLRERGEANQAVAGIRERLAKGGTSRWAALATLAEVPAPEVAADLVALARGRDRGLRLASIEALGKAAVDGSAPAAKALVRLVRDRDAGIRAATCQALAMGAAGVTRRTRRVGYRAVTRLLADRDLRVRGACVHAAARLEPRLFSRQLVRLKKSPQGTEMQLGLARGLAAVPGKLALSTLTELAAAADPMVRAAAVTSLAERPEESAAETLRAMVQRVDDSEEVRLALARAAHDPESIAAVIDDPSARVAAIARMRQMRKLGREGRAPSMAKLMNANDDAGRIVLAGAWLGARKAASASGGQ